MKAGRKEKMKESQHEKGYYGEAKIEGQNRKTITGQGR